MRDQALSDWANTRTRRIDPPPKKAMERKGKLVIVESPAKAKTVGRFLGKGFTVRASVGHVRDLLRSELSVDVDNDFTPKYRVPNEKRQVVKEIKELAKHAEEIYLATDPDREGEAIAWHLMEAAAIDPRLSPSGWFFTRSPNRRSMRPLHIRARSIWTWWMPNRPGACWTGWWATASARCCGKRCAAACPPGGCNRWRCAWWLSAKREIDAFHSGRILDDRRRIQTRKAAKQPSGHAWCRVDDAEARSANQKLWRANWSGRYGTGHITRSRGSSAANAGASHRRRLSPAHCSKKHRAAWDTPPGGRWPWRSSFTKAWMWAKAAQPV